MLDLKKQNSLLQSRVRGKIIKSLHVFHKHVLFSIWSNRNCAVWVWAEADSCQSRTSRWDWSFWNQDPELEKVSVHFVRFPCSTAGFLKLYFDRKPFPIPDSRILIPKTPVSYMQEQAVKGFRIENVAGLWGGRFKPFAERFWKRLMAHCPRFQWRFQNP